nr:25S rRNA (uracil2634-N3)-methyltransferase [Ipomoea batatas]GMD76402.1 25S rRNA (uracil2634-N3)-methyltransferase [Ipomoea batatas]
MDALFETLVSQSSATKFYKIAAAGGQSSITGLFQCRGDLSASDCSDCVQKIADMSKNLCGDSIAGRVHRAVQIPASRTHRAALQALWETALGEIAKGVETGNEFYTDGYESVFILGPCEGDLGSGDYVKIAAEKSKRTCGSAISAQMYLQQCYITLKKQWQLSLENWPVWPGVGSCLSAIHKISFQEKDPFQVGEKNGRARTGKPPMSMSREDFLNEHYDNAFSNIVTLRRRGCVVMHGVDATHMANHPFLQWKTFDRIVFNFPLDRVRKKKSRSLKIRRNQALVSAFLENAKKMLDEDGEIHIRHKTNGLEREWGIIDLAEEQGVELARAVSFRLDDYPGYNTKFGNGGDRNFNCYPSKTFIFRRRPVSHLEAGSLDCAG